MKRPQITIATGMVLTAILAVDAGLIRAFFVQEMFHGGLLIFIALQVGLWRFLRSREHARRFWLGFEVCGLASVLLLLGAELWPESRWNACVTASIDGAYTLASNHLPASLADSLIDEHLDLFLAVVYFVPELGAALVGGAICSWRADPR